MFITESAESVQDIFSPIKKSVTFIIFIANLESISTMHHEPQRWEDWELGSAKDTALFRTVGLVRSPRLESYRYIPQRRISALMWTVRVCSLSLQFQWEQNPGFCMWSWLQSYCAGVPARSLMRTTTGILEYMPRKKPTYVLWLVVFVGYIHKKRQFWFLQKSKINVKTNHISLHLKLQYEERQ